MMDPLGLQMDTGLMVGRMLVRGIDVVKKWAVVPVSAHTSVQWCVIVGMAGAPDTTEERAEEILQ